MVRGKPYHVPRTMYHVPRTCYHVPRTSYHFLNHFPLPRTTYHVPLPHTTYHFPYHFPIPPTTSHTTSPYHLPPPLLVQFVTISGVPNPTLGCAGGYREIFVCPKNPQSTIICLKATCCLLLKATVHVSGLWCKRWLMDGFITVVTIIKDTLCH